VAQGRYYSLSAVSCHAARHDNPACHPCQLEAAHHDVSSHRSQSHASRHRRHAGGRGRARHRHHTGGRGHSATTAAMLAVITTRGARGRAAAARLRLCYPHREQMRRHGDVEWRECLTGRMDVEWPGKKRQRGQVTGSERTGGERSEMGDKRLEADGGRVCERLEARVRILYLYTASNGRNASEVIQRLRITRPHRAGLISVSCPCQHCGPELRPRHGIITGPCQAWARWPPGRTGLGPCFSVPCQCQCQPSGPGPFGQVYP
jgi:hypothetical protein